MFKAKDRIGSLSPWMVACLGLCLSLLDAGCAGISGLRSVGTERPSLLGFWDRQGPGSPAPENDAYAQAMRGGPVRGEAIADRSDPSGSGRNDQSTGRADEIAESNEPTSPTSTTARTSPKVADESIRVALGRPEPLPGLVLAAAERPRPASTGSAPRWKSETDDPTHVSSPGLSPPGERHGSKDEPRAQLAERGERSSPAGPSREFDSAALLARAEARLDAMQTYQVKITRLERVSGQLQPEEDILLSIRRDPQAVRLEWSSGPSKGREVIYSKTLDPRMIFVHMPTTAIPLPAMRIPVDSPLVMRNSRHAITDAGFDTIVENLRKSAGPSEKDRADLGTLSYEGLERPVDVDQACHHFMRRTAAGERWNVYLDAHSLLPRMVLAEDSRGDLIERYIYREIRENPTELAAAGAFEPIQRWGESKGLLSRFARASPDTKLPATSESATR
jgi:Protein of unknown function (DUF1571)